MQPFEITHPGFRRRGAFSDLKNGDVIAVSFSCNGFVSAKDDALGKVRARLTIDGTESTMPGFGMVVTKRGEVTELPVSYDFTMLATGRYVVAADAEAVSVAIQGTILSQDPDAGMHLLEPMCLAVQVLRANPLPA